MKSAAHNPKPELADLKPALDQLVRDFDLRHLSPDPVEIVHEYSDPAEQEIVGFIAAALAYGNVKCILRDIRQVLSCLGSSPRKTILSLTANDALDLLRGFRHRFNSASDMARLLLMLRRILEEHGSLQSLFLEKYQDDAPHIGPALEHFVSRILSIEAPAVDRFEARHGIVSRADYFLPLPSRGSACKRLNLYLRWMVRRADGVDFGIWNRVSPSQLLIPLDTHVARISRNLGLLTRAATDWKAACELTQTLKRLDPQDPVRYDFAICRLGILGYCRHDSRTDECRGCPLAPFCAGNRNGSNRL